MVITCGICGQDLGDGNGHYRLVQGYMRIRPRGANEVALRVDLDQWRCHGCMSALKAGYDPDQPNLLRGERR